MQKSGLAAIMDIADGSGIIDLGEISEKRVSAECLSMYNVNGPMRKTAKCKLLQGFIRQNVDMPREYISLVDMGLIWHLATPILEDREIKRRSSDDYKWKDHFGKICSLVISRHDNAQKIILVSGKYTG